jgi:hypothetical protein
MIALKKKSLTWALIGLILAGCNTPPLQATQVPTATRWIDSNLTTTTVVPATLTPVLPTPTEVMSATSLPSPKPQETPTQAAMQITPIVTGPSESLWYSSPDSRWLPYIDFNAQTLHFIDTSKSSICDFPSLIHYTPDRSIAWLPDGRVVVQAANGVETGLPCSTFTSATPQEILFLDHSDPSFSPDGRYQVVFQRGAGNSQGVNATIELKEVASGKIFSKTTFTDLPRGGANLPGSWLDPSHFLIPASGDQGPLLISPGQPVIQIAPEFFHLPLRPGDGTFDAWMAIRAVTANPSQFHLMLVGTTGPAGQRVRNPLQLYHSESGQVETLPYLASQATFSNDGHWLLVNPNPDRSSTKNWIRPIDPPGAPFEPLSEKIAIYSTWSPDGSMYYQVSQDLTTISVYTFPDGTFLGAWQARDYELSPSWSPDWKYLAVWGRKHTDYDQESIFVIPMATQK